MTKKNIPSLQNICLAGGISLVGVFVSSGFFTSIEAISMGPSFDKPETSMLILMFAAISLVSAGPVVAAGIWLTIVLFRDIELGAFVFRRGLWKGAIVGASLGFLLCLMALVLSNFRADPLVFLFRAGEGIIVGFGMGAMVSGAVIQFVLRPKTFVR